MVLYFEARSKIKEQETKFLLIPLSKFTAIKRTRNKCLTKANKRSKITRNIVLVKSWKLAVVVFEAINKAR